MGDEIFFIVLWHLGRDFGLGRCIVCNLRARWRGECAPKVDCAFFFGDWFDIQSGENGHLSEGFSLMRSHEPSPVQNQKEICNQDLCLDFRKQDSKETVLPQTTVPGLLLSVM